MVETEGPVDRDDELQRIREALERINHRHHTVGTPNGGAVWRVVAGLFAGIVISATSFYFILGRNVVTRTELRAAEERLRVGAPYPFIQQGGPARMRALEAIVGDLEERLREVERRP